MNRNIINFILILAASSQLFASTTPVYKKGYSDGELKNGSCDKFKEDPEETGMPHYQEPPLKYYVTGAVNFHQGMLHAMDETNQKNGKSSHYYTREVDNSDFSEVKMPLYHDRESKSWKGKEHVPYFFFNAGTEVKDLVFKPKEEFNKAVEKAKTENKTKMLLEGRYNTYTISGTFGNTQEEKTYGIVGDGSDEEKKDAQASEFYISVEDFKKNLAVMDKDGRTVIGKKSQKEINAFFAKQEKVHKAGYYLGEDGKLFDKNGYEVFIDVDLVTIQNPVGSNISKVDREKRDEVYSKRFVYEKTPNERLLYTADGDLIIEDNKGVNNQDKKENKDSNAMGRTMLFLGQGLIKGTFDMGKKQNGKDRIAVFRESGIGRYGSNVVMGPESSFKNIDKIQVGGGGSSELKTGIASLTIDIDPNSRGTNGALNKNALKNSDSTGNENGNQNGINGRIKFENSEGRDKYYLELMASRVGKDEVVDLGQYNDLKYISDSIAHRVIVPTVEKKVNAESGAKNTMVSIQVKDNIKRLNDEKNDLYKSIKDSGQLGKLHETLTNSNKKTRFTKKDMELIARNNDILADAILNQKDTDETVTELSQFHLTEKEKEAAKESIEKIKKNSRISDKLEEMKEVEKLSKDDDFTKLLKDLKTLNEELKGMELKSGDDSKKSEIKEKIEKICNKEDCDCLEKHLKSKYGSTKPEQYKWDNIDLNTINEYIKTCKNDGTKETVDMLITSISGLLKYSETYTPEEAKKGVIKELTNGSSSFEYDTLKQILQYTIREEEALEEFKTILSQIQDTNIYSKLNKIANNEITTYTSLPFEIRHSLTGDKRIAKGGFISSRTVQSHWKGNTYTGYGLYEKNIANGVRAGLVFGGANTNYKETYSRTAKTVSTNSNIKGVSVYAGGYINRPLYEELRWITGVGVQYGRYAVRRDMKNNYQQLSAKGNANVGAFNTYSGLMLSYPLQEDVEVQVKGLISYSFINQGKIHENGDLNLNIQSKNYHYLDSEIGVSLNKTLYDSDRKSNLSAGISAIYGLTGYKNTDLSAKVSGANSSFHIAGDKIKKDAVKILLDYNVQLDAGMTYGLEGTYITNDDESNVKIGLKAGYTF